MKVNVVVADRNSVACGQLDIEFSTYADLNVKIDEFLDSLPFYKVSLEIEPLDYKPTEEDHKNISLIEEGGFKS